MLYDARVPLESGRHLQLVPPSAGSSQEMNGNRPGKEVLSKYLEDNLKSGFICLLLSNVGAPIIYYFCQEEGRFASPMRRLSEPQLCHHQEEVSASAHQQTLNHLCSAEYFTTKINICNAYHCICIAAGQEWMTASQTRYRHFKHTYK